METTFKIPTKTITRSRIHEVDFNALEFGKYVADHMLICDYRDGEWQTPHIVPYANLSLDPATLALHYGQTVFEGMKAFRMHDGRINIFRIDRHYNRFARSLQRMCMAIPPREVFTEGLQKLIELDKDWVPHQAGASLYIRPFIYASEAKFGVKISDQYRLVIISGPVPDLFAKPIRVKVETDYVRAAPGGTGFAKCGGNYGGAFYPTQLAKEEGFDQVLWTDTTHTFIEESGMMNAMFVIDGQIITPPLSDSILDGVTRESLLTIARHLSFSTLERPISVEELQTAFQENRITEAFGAGTAAVVAPIGVININGHNNQLPAYSEASIHAQLKDKLNKIRFGLEADLFGWNCAL